MQTRTWDMGIEMRGKDTPSLRNGHGQTGATILEDGLLKVRSSVSWVFGTHARIRTLKSSSWWEISAANLCTFVHVTPSFPGRQACSLSFSTAPAFSAALPASPSLWPVVTLQVCSMIVSLLLSHLDGLSTSQKIGPPGKCGIPALALVISPLVPGSV